MPPHIKYILEQLNIAKVFSKFDLKSGYRQVWIAKRDIYKTAFQMEHGHYEFKVMPFALTSTSSTFNRMRMCVFTNLVGKCVFIFMDNILIVFTTWERSNMKKT